MAAGLPYDSDGGRALAAGITSLMTGTAYKRSAELAGVVGAYDGYARNAQAHKRVMRKHAAASDSVRSVTSLDGDVLGWRPRRGSSACASARRTAGATPRPPSWPRPDASPATRS